MIEHDGERLSAIILAAGQGKRMQSDRAKVLHTICGKPMLSYSLDVVRAVGIEKIVVIVGHQGNLVRETFRNEDLIFVEQTEQLGTGHAVLQARNVFQGAEGTVLILCGDVPLLRASTVKGLHEYHAAGSAAVTVLTTVLKDPTGYGRVVKRANDAGVLKIVEEKDATQEEKKIGEINTGIYCADCRFLFDAVLDISNHNAQKEYYLTDMIEIACKKGRGVRALIAPDSFEVMGINTMEDLERAADFTRNRS